MAGFLSLDNGLTGILANRRALDVISQNVANAANPDYSRQQIHLGANRPLTIGNMSVGTGVSVEDITRARDSLMDTRYLQENKNLGEYNQLTEVYKEIENALNEPSEQGIRGSLSSFVSSMQNLANEPENRGSRRDVVGQATTLSNVIQRFYRSLRSISGGPSSAVDDQLTTTLDSINNIGKQIASLNQEINSAEAGGTSPNDLLDHRLKLINELSEYGDVTVEKGMNTHRVNIAGYTLVQGSRSHEFSYERPRGQADKKILYDDNNQSVVRPGGGRLKALMDLKEDKIPGLVKQLNDITVQFTDRFNDIHRNGFSLDGQTGNNFWAELPTTGEGVFRLEGLTDYGDIATKRAGYISDVNAPLIGDNNAAPANFEGDSGVYAQNAAGNDIGAYSGNLEINGKTFSYDMREDSAQDIIDRINESDNGASAYLSAANRLVIKGEQDNNYELDSLRDTGLLLDKANILTVGGSDQTGQTGVDDITAALVGAGNTLAGDSRIDETTVSGTELAEGTLEFDSSNTAGFSVNYDAEDDSLEDVVTRINDASADVGSNIVAGITDDNRLRIFAGETRNMTSTASAGDDVVINLADASDLSVGDEIWVSDDAPGNSEMAKIKSIDLGTDSITVAHLDNTYNNGGEKIQFDDPTASFKVNDTASQQLVNNEGSDAVSTVSVNSTTGFEVGDVVTVSDSSTNNSEKAIVRAIGAGTLDLHLNAGGGYTNNAVVSSSSATTNVTAVAVGPDAATTVEVPDASIFQEGDVVEFSELDVGGNIVKEKAIVKNVDVGANEIEVNLDNVYTGDVGGGNASVRRVEDKHNKRNLLTALGMHRLYNKNDTSTKMAIEGQSRGVPLADQVTGLKVDERIDNNPDLIAAAGGVDQNLNGVANVSNGAGDGSNMYELSNLNGVPIMDANNNSTDDFISSMVSGLGNEASLIYSEQRSSESLVNQIQDRIRSVSSVSLDEEMTNMLRYQQAYQASARVISAARDMANAVFQLV